MAQPRSSLAMALEYYKGPRPGIALTIAAVALVGALVVDQRLPCRRETGHWDEYGRRARQVGDEDVETYMREGRRRGGERVGLEYAESFKRFKL